MTGDSIRSRPRSFCNTRRRAIRCGPTAIAITTEETIVATPRWYAGMVGSTDAGWAAFVPSRRDRPTPNDHDEWDVAYDYPVVVASEETRG